MAFFLQPVGEIGGSDVPIKAQARSSRVVGAINFYHLSRKPHAPKSAGDSNAETPILEQRLARWSQLTSRSFTAPQGEAQNLTRGRIRTTRISTRRRWRERATMQATWVATLRPSA